MMYIIFMLVRAPTLWYYSLIMMHLSGIILYISFFPQNRTTDFPFFPLLSFFFFFSKLQTFCWTNLPLTSSFVIYWPIFFWFYVWMYHGFHFVLDVLGIFLCICDHVGFDDNTLQITAHSCRSFPVALSWCTAFYAPFQGMPHTGCTANMSLEELTSKTS